MNQIVSDIVSCENQINQFFLNQKIARELEKQHRQGEKHLYRTLDSRWKLRYG